MSNQIIAASYIIISIALSVFVIYRLQIGKTRGAGGSGFIYAGLTLIIISISINFIQQLSSYPQWFLPGFYIYIAILKFLFLTAGFILFAIGLSLHFSFWGERDQEVSNNLNKLRLLESLQQESKFPFPMSELLDRILKGLLAGLDEEAGALFLLNRSQRQFVLATSVGLTKEEISLLEYYPYGGNIISQSIEDESPLLSSDFRSLGGKAQLAVSRFRSILVVPLISGKNKLGALLLFSQEERRYTREFLALMSPITEWLSEKIEVSRLGRELSKSARELETSRLRLEEFFGSLERIIKSVRSASSPSSFADKCIGLAGSDEVWLLGLTNGRLHIYGGTGETPDFSENFKAALINAIPKSKPLILNQEGTDETRKSFIIRSSALLPLDDRGNVILFRNSNGPFALSDHDLKTLETVAAIAGLIINNTLARSVSDSRNRGLESISAVLKMKLSTGQTDKDVKTLVEILSRISTQFCTVLCLRRSDESLAYFHSSHTCEDINELSLSPGEGSTGRATVMKTSEVVFGSDEVADNLSKYDEENRNILFRLFGDMEKPAFQADYPIILDGRVDYVMTFFGFGDSNSDNLELHRLISVVVGLMNLKLEITLASSSRYQPPAIAFSGEPPAIDLNELNNDLAAISGYCQLARRDPNLSGETIKAFDSILNAADLMAERLKGSSPIKPKSIDESSNFNEIIKNKFRLSNISGNLYMIGQRPVEISLKLKDIPKLGIGEEELNSFLDSVCRNFAADVSDDEIVTLNTYTQQTEIFLDISRHRKNFPPVEPVAGFGRYMQPDALSGDLRKAGFMDQLFQFHGEFAYDKYGKSPSYYSFRFHQEPQDKPSAPPVEKEALTILAIDDQVVILDLLAAMSQSLGYRILTARNGNDGLALFNSKNPDIIIADLAMPGMSGLELARKIKSISPSTPIILVTGWGVAVDGDSLKRAGVDFVLNKPFRLEQLSELIAKIRLSGIRSR